jgi:outer membrane receptor protein involved in Fe transport
VKSWFTKKDRLLAGTIIAGASVVGFAPSAVAQEGQDTSEEIVVTGSRIPQPNLIGTSPVTQVTADDITAQGVTRLEDMTNQLPQVFAAQGSAISNGATGTAQVNLRGLGAVRNLVLINGRRMPYGSPLSAPADLNQIPGAMVDRVEVLTGGASAVYGSDAITGVVNFIMRDNFEGFRLDGQYGFYQHSNDSDDGFIREVIADRNTTNPSQYNLPPDDVTDGYGKEITMVFGTSSEDGKGNVTAYVGYRTNDAVLQANRDFSACAIGNPVENSGLNQIPGVPAGAIRWTCGGSATSFPGYFYFGGSAFTIDQGNGNLVPFTSANLYNFGPLNYYQRPDERYTLGAFGHYEINEHIEAYAEAMFSDYRSVSQIAPSGDFFNTNTINCGNPLLPANIVAVGLCTPVQVTNNDTVSLYIARRNVEGGGRQDDLNYESYRIVAGFRGALTDNWSYDLYGLYSRVNLSRTYLNDFSVSRLGRAINVVDVAGVPTCQSVVDGTDPACVPWDIFTPGGVTPEALAYLQIPLMQRGETIQQIVSGSVTGDWGVGSPFAESNLETSFGFEYRRDELVSRVDTNFQSGDGAGQGGPTLPLSGVTDVFELFGEARLPLIEDAPGAHLLSVDVAYRFSDYNSGTTTDTYKMGAEWAPVEDIRFRGSYQHAVRAPNIIELFGAQGAGLFNLGFDPCDAVNSPVAVPAICIGDPTVNGWEVTAAQSAGGGLNNPAGQYNGIFGGNPNLEPEEADTYTVGFVFQPTFMEGLSVSLDYWNIELTNAIAAPAQAIVANCYFGGDLSSCALIQRLPNGRLRNTAQGVTAINTNIGGVDTSGWDLNANYNVDIGSAGRLGFQLITTKVEELITDVGGGAAFPAFDCVGLWSGDADCGTPTPEWRSRMRVSWETPWDVEIIGTWRYFSEVTRETMVPFPGTPVDPNSSVANRIGTVLDATNYFDVAGNWDVFENTRIRFGVNNILDQDPPISTNGHTGAGFGNGNTFPQVYDTLGRWIFIGATVDF